MLTVGLVILPNNLALADNKIPPLTKEDVGEAQIPPLSKGGLGGVQTPPDNKLIAQISPLSKEELGGVQTPPDNGLGGVQTPPDNELGGDQTTIGLPGLEFLAPIPGQVFSASDTTVNIALQYPQNATIELKINDRLIDKSYLKKIEQTEEGNLSINNWEGVELQPGDNIITATGTTKDGQVFAPVSVTVVQESVANQPTLADSVETGSNLKQTTQGEDLEPISLDKPLQILSPKPQQLLQTPATSVVVKYPEGAKVELFVNDNPVNDQESLGRVEMDSTNGLFINSWYGLGLKEGENIITAKVTLKDGTELPAESVTVILAGQPTQLQIESLQPRIPADGRSNSVIQGRLLDKNGQVSNWSTVVTLESSSGKFIGDDLKPDQPGFQVETKRGEFQAVLQAGNNAENVRIMAKTAEFETYTQMQFITQLRQDPILTGVIDLRFGQQGLNYNSRYRDFLPPDGDYNYQFDVYGAAFATGALGEWKYTAAFNSDRPLFDEDEIFEDQYPIYNDNSTTEREAESRDQLYLRLERSRPNILDPDYIMWGTYNTEEFSNISQEYGAINRQLQGFKGNYSFGNLQVSALFATNTQAFQRDTIPPDGTRGDYFLSHRNVRQGSEMVYLELEELNRPGTVISRQQLASGSDYEIDYDRGSIFFTEPVFQTAISEESDILVRRIVVTYDYEGVEAQDNQILAGRVRYHFGDQTKTDNWIGGSYFLEDRGSQDFELWSADGIVSLGENGSIIAEYAHSKNTAEMSGNVEGSAYRLEIDGRITDKISGNAYYRNTDAGFSNNATTSFVPGQTRYGARLQTDLSLSTSLVFNYDHEDNFGTAPRQLTSLEDLLSVSGDPIPGNRVDNSLTTISAGVRQKIGDADLNVDWIYRDRRDNMEPQALESQSHQIRSRLTVPLTDTLNVNVLNETNISNQSDVLYPDRTAVGLDWQIIDGVNLNVAQQWFTSGDYAGKSITNLGINADYNIGRDTTLTGRYTIALAEETINSGALGIKQKWEILPGLQADFGYEHVFSSFTNTAAGQQYIQPFASGQSASSLGLASGDTYSVGLAYTDNPDWKADVRFEHRTSDNNSRTTLDANLSGKLTENLIALMSYNQSSAANQTLEAMETTRDFNVGLGYSSDKISALFKYEYRKNPSTIPETLLLGTGTGSEDHILSLEASYQPNWRLEFFAKYAMKASTTYLADEFVSNSIIHLGQFRATYRFAYDWDIQGEARILTQPSAGYTETGLVLDLGYYLTPEIRLGVGYTLGNIDDRDFSGSRNGSGFHVGVTMKLNGLFDGFGEQKPVPPQQQTLGNADYENLNSINTDYFKPTSKDNPQTNQNTGNTSTESNPQPLLNNTQNETTTPETNESSPDTLINNNSDQQSYNNLVGNYVITQNLLENLNNEVLIDELVKNQFSEEQIFNYSEIWENDLNLLTEYQYKNIRW